MSFLIFNAAAFVCLSIIMFFNNEIEQSKYYGTLFSIYMAAIFVVAELRK